MELYAKVLMLVAATFAFLPPKWDPAIRWKERNERNRRRRR